MTHKTGHWQVQGVVHTLNHSKDIIIYLQQKTDTQYTIMLKIHDYKLPKLQLYNLTADTLSAAKLIAVNYADNVAAERRKQYYEVKIGLKQKIQAQILQRLSG